VLEKGTSGEWIKTFYTTVHAIIFDLNYASHEMIRVEGREEGEI
jgi:hypothetical protein